MTSSRQRGRFREEETSVRTISILRRVYTMHLIYSMKKRCLSHPVHARVPDQGFLRALLGVLTGRAFVSTRFSPPRYPANARSEDMTRIGADMYRSFQLFNEREESTETSAD